jgi:hypothetical protein
MRSTLAVALTIAALFLVTVSLCEQTKPADKNIPDFDLRGISFTECACTA